MPKCLRLLTASICTLSAALAVSGCSTASVPTIGSINPFSSGSTISEVDRAYLQAAGSWDLNHDSVVTCNEWKSYAEDLFNGADANHDDFLEASEWQNITNIDKMFVTADIKYFDANGDGKVSRQEFVDKPNPAFVLMDRAGSCKLNANQIASARSKTEYDLSGSKPQNSDPREQGGQQGQAANGALPGQ
jgi:EF hand